MAPWHENMIAHDLLLHSSKEWTKIVTDGHDDPWIIKALRDTDKSIIHLIVIFNFYYLDIEKV